MTLGMTTVFVHVIQRMKRKKESKTISFIL